MRRLIAVALLSSVMVVLPAGSAVSSSHLSPGCQDLNAQTTTFYLVSSSTFAAGEVLTVDFTGTSVAPEHGELSIADSAGQFNNPILVTTSFPDRLTYTFDGTETGAGITVSADNNPLAVFTCDLPPVDTDGDSVPDADDSCPGSDFAADLNPDTNKNRLWSNAAGDFVYGNGAPSGTTVSDTAGCSASQIIASAHLGKGHTNHGISRGALTAYLKTL